MKKQIKLSIFAFLTLCAACAPVMGMGEKLKDFYNKNRTVSNIMLLVGAGATGYGIYEIYQKSTIDSEQYKLREKVIELQNLKKEDGFFSNLNGLKIYSLCLKNQIGYCKDRIQDTVTLITEREKCITNMTNLINAIKTTKYGIFTSCNSKLIADLWDIFNTIEAEETEEQKLINPKLETLNTLFNDLKTEFRGVGYLEYLNNSIKKIKSICEEWKIKPITEKSVALTFENNIKSLITTCTENPQNYSKLIEKLIESLTTINTERLKRISIQEKINILTTQFNVLNKGEYRGTKYYEDRIGNIKKLCTQWKVEFSTTNKSHVRLTFEDNIKLLVTKYTENLLAHSELIDSLIELTKVPQI